MIHPDLVEDMEPPEHCMQKRERKPSNIVEITDTMLIENEQSLHTQSGRSFAREYYPEAKGLVGPTK